MSTVAAAIVSAVIGMGSAGYTLHGMYEDEPQIEEVRQEMVAMGEKSVNTILMQMMLQSQTRYEDELVDLYAKKRNGHATEYEMRKIDRLETRIKQIERELMLKEAN